VLATLRRAVFARGRGPCVGGWREPPGVVFSQTSANAQAVASTGELSHRRVNCRVLAGRAAATPSRPGSRRPSCRWVSVALQHCSPHTRLTKRIGASASDATMRPNPSGPGRAGRGGLGRRPRHPSAGGRPRCGRAAGPVSQFPSRPCFPCLGNSPGHQRIATGYDAFGVFGTALPEKISVFFIQAV
jgi:hypothetical protein